MNKRVLTQWSLLAGAALFALTPSPSFGVCPDTAPAQHGFGLAIEGCPDAAPVAGFAFVAASPNINTQNVPNIICESSDELPGSSAACQPEAGARGDGFITIQYDWGGPLGNGSLCPVTATSGPGDGRNIVLVVANDGSSILYSVGWEPGIAQFLMDAAHPADFSNLRCSHDGGRPKVVSASGSEVCVNVVAPQVFSDCDPGSLGVDFGTCPDPAADPTPGPGRLYTTTGACGSSPDPRLPSSTFTTSVWTLANVSGGPSGSLCLTVPTAADGQCSFVGASGMLGTTETAAVVGALQVAGPLAAADRAIDVRAAQAGGQVKISFRTVSELLVTGFNVVTASGRKVNANLIPARGVNGAGATYEVSLKRGDFRNERALSVQSVLSDGRTINSDTTSF
jgi:hypothetical protein